MIRNRNNLYPEGSLPRCHWNKQRGRRITAKMPFESLTQARKYIEAHQLNNYNAYQCSVCGKYHIGHK